MNSPPGATIPPRRREFRRQNAHNACGHDTDTTAALYVPAVHNGVNRNASDAVNRSRHPRHGAAGVYQENRDIRGSSCAVGSTMWVTLLVDAAMNTHGVLALVGEEPTRCRERLNLHLVER